MALNVANKTLSLAFQKLSKCSYEMFKKEYLGAQRYMVESRADNYTVAEYESVLTTFKAEIHPYCVLMDLQCHHELIASTLSCDENGKKRKIYLILLSLEVGICNSMFT
jgi:hypothetical protein